MKAASSLSLLDLCGLIISLPFLEVPTRYFEGGPTADLTTVNTAPILPALTGTLDLQVVSRGMGINLVDYALDLGWEEEFGCVVKLMEACSGVLEYLDVKYDPEGAIYSVSSQMSNLNSFQLASPKRRNSKLSLSCQRPGNRNGLSRPSKPSHLNVETGPPPCPIMGTAFRLDKAHLWRTSGHSSCGERKEFDSALVAVAKANEEWNS